MLLSVKREDAWIIHFAERVNVIQRVKVYAFENRSLVNPRIYRKARRGARLTQISRMELLELAGHGGAVCSRMLKIYESLKRR